MADKTCPSCAETIKAAAIRCRFCGETFTVSTVISAEPAVTASTPYQPPAWRSTRKIIAVTGVAIVAAIGMAARDSARPTCDGRADARDRWIETPTFDVRAAQNRGAAPRDYGYRALGKCSEKILSRKFTCDEREVLETEADDPWLRDAAGLGFTTYVCELANGTDERVEFPIDGIIPSGRAVASPPR